VDQVVTLEELERHWTVEQVMDACDALDAVADARGRLDRRMRKEAEAKAKMR
jgi:hypothetical protein